MAKGAGPTSLNVSKGRESLPFHGVVSRLVACSGTVGWPTGRVHPTVGCNTKAAYQASCAVVGMEPFSGHFALERASKVSIDVCLHGRCGGPTAVPESTMARAGRHRAEDLAAHHHHPPASAELEEVAAQAEESDSAVVGAHLGQVC